MLFIRFLGRLSRALRANRDQPFRGSGATSSREVVQAASRVLGRSWGRAWRLNPAGCSDELE